MRLEDMVQDIRDIQDGSGQVATELNTKCKKTQQNKERKKSDVEDFASLVIYTLYNLGFLCFCMLTKKT